MREKLRNSRLLKGALLLTWVGTLGWLTLRLADQAVAAAVRLHSILVGRSFAVGQQ